MRGKPSLRRDAIGRAGLRRGAYVTAVAVLAALVMPAASAILTFPAPGGHSWAGPSAASHDDSRRGTVGPTERIAGAAVAARERPHPAAGAAQFGVVATLAVRDQPSAEVYDPFNSFEYVLNSGSDSVTILEGTLGGATVPVGVSPSAATVDPSNGFVYVLNSASGNVTVLNGSKVMANPSVGLDPVSLTYDAADGYVYVADFGRDNVTVLDGTTVLSTLTVGNTSEAPYGIVYDAADSDVYVSEAGSASVVSVLQGTSSVANVTLAPGEAIPTYLLYDPADAGVYLLDSGTDNVSVLTGTTLTATLPVGVDPVAAVYDSADSSVYVLNSGSDNVTLLNGTLEAGSIGLGFSPSAGVFDPAQQDVVVAGGANSAGILRGTSLIDTLDVGYDPSAASYDDADQFVYVANEESSNVSVLGFASFYDLAFTETGLPSGTPWFVEVSNASTGVLVNSSVTSSLEFTVINGTYEYQVWNNTTEGAYFPSPTSGNVEVEGTNATVEVTFAPVGEFALAFDATGLPLATEWSVAIFGSSTGTEFNQSTNATLGFVVPNGTYSFDIGNVTVGSALYVPAPSSGTVQVAGTAEVTEVVFAALAEYNLTLNETGLPLGTPWSATVSSSSTGTLLNASTNATLGFTVPNGAYSYVVADAATGAGLFAPDPSSGVATVAGSNLTIEITFSLAPLFNLTFDESGLPTGTFWDVGATNDSAGSFFNESTNSSLGLAVPGGAYSFVVGNTSANGVTFVPTPAAGDVTVAKAGATVDVTFSPLLNYSLTFSETGLPVGTEWAVEECSGATGCSVNASTNTTVGFSEPNGTYGFTIGPVPGYEADPATGSTTVEGSDVTVSVAFGAPEFAVSFSETGLPSGTEWWVNVTDGPSKASTTTSLAIDAANGTYDFSVATANKEYASVPGSVTVQGEALLESVEFVPVLYAVTYTESGLPAGTEWWVNVTGGPSTSSTTATLSFSEPNATYAVSVGTTDKEYSAAGGSLPVDGAPLSETATFALVTYTITFAETGLPSGTSWSVAVGGILHTATAGTLTFAESNGTYAYTPSASGYSSSASSVTVRGSDVGPLAVAFAASSPSTPSSSPSGLTALDGALIGGAVGVLGTCAGLYLLRRQRKAPPASENVAPPTK